MATQALRLLRAEHLLASIVLLIALALFYHDVVFGGRTFLQLGYTARTMPVSAGGGAYGYPATGEHLTDPLMWVRALAKLRLARIDPLREIERQRSQRTAEPSTLSSQIVEVSN